MSLSYTVEEKAGNYTRCDVNERQIPDLILRLLAAGFT